MLVIVQRIIFRRLIHRSIPKELRKHIFQTDTSHCIFITQACTSISIMIYYITHEVVVFDNLCSNQPLFCLQLISPIFFQYLFTSTFSHDVLCLVLHLYICISLHIYIERSISYDEYIYRVPKKKGPT